MGMGSGNWQLTATSEGYVPTQTSVFVTQIGQNPKVVITLEKIAVIDSSITKGTDLALIEEAGKLFEERKYDEALTLLQEFLINNPTAYQTHINIGDCYKEKGVDFCFLISVCIISVYNNKRCCNKVYRRSYY